MRSPGTPSATSCSRASWTSLDDPVTALDEVGALLGRPRPGTADGIEPLDIEAEVTGLEDDDPHRAHRIRGQVAVASTPGRVRRVRLLPERPRACSPTPSRRYASADLLLLGPRFLVHQRAAPPARARAARRARVTARPGGRSCSTWPRSPGRRPGSRPEQHLAVLASTLRTLRVDAVLADTDVGPVPDRLQRAAAALLAPGGRVHLAPDRRDGPDDTAARPPCPRGRAAAVLAVPDPARAAAGLPAGAGGRRPT